jgi:predicted phage terminase large subunit-like protein
MSILKGIKDATRNAMGAAGSILGAGGRPISPADWAHTASRGLWLSAPHLKVLDRRLIRLAQSRRRREGARLLVMMPPQHGKSSLISQYFPGWWLGTFPDDPIILASYEADFAAKWGKRARDAFEAHAPSEFHLDLDPDAGANSFWGVKGRLGSMSTAGCGGAITGNPAALFLIDDPIKGPEQANSETQRENDWEWFTQVALTRLKRGSCMGMLYTAWNEDDLGQRIIRNSLAGNLEPWDILRIPAIAETQEERDEWAADLGLQLGLPDPIGREPGEPLWPEMHPIEELEMRRRTDPYGFEALYQGRPRAKGGNFFKRDWWKGKMIDAREVPRDVERCRFWDKAASEDSGDWTAGVLMGMQDSSGRYFVEHVARDRMSPYESDEKILATALHDMTFRGGVRIRGDQDPGQAGKRDAAAFVRLLAGYDVATEPISGAKEVRARAFASAVEGGNVFFVKAPWNDAYFRELEGFPRGKHDDQVDASAGAFNELAGRSQRLRVGSNPTAHWRGKSSKPADDAAA